MFVLDATGVAALVAIAALRFGVPVLGIWLISKTLKRALPGQV
jgi:hypothetical protein